MTISHQDKVSFVNWKSCWPFNVKIYYQLTSYWYQKTQNPPLLCLHSPPKSFDFHKNQECLNNLSFSLDLNKFYINSMPVARWSSHLLLEKENDCECEMLPNSFLRLRNNVGVSEEARPSVVSRDPGLAYLDGGRTLPSGNKNNFSFLQLLKLLFIFYSICWKIIIFCFLNLFPLTLTVAKLSWKLVTDSCVDSRPCSAVLAYWD